MLDTLTANEAAERLGVSVTTIKNWLNQLPGEKEHDSRGRVRINIHTMNVLETVKALRDEDCGYETIRRRIGPVPDDQKSPDSEHQADDNQPTFDRKLVDTSIIVEAVTTAIANQTELAERYARATYEIGELRATTKALEADRDRVLAELAEAKTKIMLLEAPTARPWWKLW
jgi:hypothetical protein